MLSVMPGTDGEYSTHSLLRDVDGETRIARFRYIGASTSEEEERAGS